jgi:hypothetical protein
MKLYTLLQGVGVKLQTADPIRKLRRFSFHEGKDGVAFVCILGSNRRARLHGEAGKKGAS